MTEVGDRETVGESGEPTPRAASSSPALARGDLVGRYVVLSRLGAGGMGIVYAGYDPELDRKVALKLLLAEAAEGSEGHARLLREAQALARLSHPNIVGIHDVGTVDERVWIAMEFVAGQTLREWSAAQPRSWTEVLDLIAAAGCGLAAAHRAGLVHRDVKPENIMVGDDGRVRVMDFGIARSEHAPSADADAPRPRHPLAGELTRAGSVMGTPAYMAAEQHAGLPTDGRTDQFSLCVTAWEALYGERPFVGSSLAELATNVLEGRTRDPPRGTPVPGWLRAILQRGLSPSMDARWSGVDALLEACDRGRSRSRARRVVALGGALACVGVAIVGARTLDERRRTSACEQSGAAIAEVWDDAARTTVSDALVATGVAYAPTTAKLVTPWLDAHAQAWRDARTQACLDADVRGTWTADLLDRALWCLDERRMQLEALVGELSRADDRIVLEAVTAATGLSPVDACRDADALERLPPPPLDRREDVRAARAELSRAGALTHAGKYADALAVAQSVSERAAELQWPPLEVAARVEEMWALEQLDRDEDAARVGGEAYFAAARAGAWDVAEAAASELVFIVGGQLDRPAEGLAWARHAEVALAHAGDPEQLREAGRLANVATAHRTAGDYAQARELLERSLAMRERALGPDHPEISSPLLNLSNVLLATGDHAEAIALIDRALAIQERSFGADHPLVASALINLAVVHNTAGDNARARVLYERALPILEQAYGRDHPRVAVGLANLALVYEATGDHAGAIALHERALAIFERTIGPDHPDIARVLANLSDAVDSSGDHLRARALLERALAITEKSMGPDHPTVGAMLGNLASIHHRAGEQARARVLYERALAIKVKAFGPDHPNVAACLGNFALVHLAEREPAKARQLLERALRIFDANDGIDEGEPEARFALARALVDARTDRARARALAEQAHDAFRNAAPGKAKQLGEVEAWLQQHASRPG